jgi:hypothetical protein
MDVISQEGQMGVDAALGEAGVGVDVCPMRRSCWCFVVTSKVAITEAIHTTGYFTPGRNLVVKSDDTDVVRSS